MLLKKISLRVLLILLLTVVFLLISMLSSNVEVAHARAKGNTSVYGGKGEYQPVAGERWCRSKHLKPNTKYLASVGIHFVAHKKLPFGTLVRFKHGRYTAYGVVVDRGPYIKGREWDISPNLAKHLHIKGVGYVKAKPMGKVKNLKQVGKK